MIVATRNGGDRELRMFELVGTFVPRASEGTLLTAELRQPALQVAAFACAARLLSEEIASLVMRTYEGDATERAPVLDSPQARLFQEPADGWTSFDLWSDLVAAVELDKHGFLWKVVAQGQVQELYPLDPAFFQVSRERGTNRKIVKAWIEGRPKDVTENVIHVRGWSPNAGASGVSTAEMHARSLRTAIAYEEYRGDYFENDGAPSLVLEVPGKPNRERRREYLDTWTRRHRQKHRVGIAWDGMKVTPVSSNLRDAQAAEVADAIVRDVARMCRIYPAELLHVSVQGTRPPASAELWSDLFFRFSMLPRMRRIERAIAADHQVYPDPRRYPRFDISEFVRGDIATTAEVVHNLVQSGVLTKNEGRAMMGLPPIEGGDVLIALPVGGGGDSIGPDAGAGDGQGADEGDGTDEGAAARALILPYHRLGNGHGELTPT